MSIDKRLIIKYNQPVPRYTNYPAVSPTHLPLLREFTFPEVDRLSDDAFLDYDDEGVTVTPLGRHFIRNICRAFDLHLLRNGLVGANQMFSKAI